MRSSDLDEYSGKNILVTGSCGGLGAQLVQKLASAGANIVVTGRSRAKLEALVAELPVSVKTVVMEADLTIPSQVSDLARRSIQAWGQIDILFNNAGTGMVSLVEESGSEEIRMLFEVNTFAPLQLIRELLPHMRKLGSGKIVNILPSAGRIPIPTAGVYGGSKAAFAALAGAMRIELIGSGVQMINVHLGTVDSLFERQARSEAGRSGGRTAARMSGRDAVTAEQVLHAAAGGSGEVWLHMKGRGLALASILWPSYVAKRNLPLRDRIADLRQKKRGLQYRKWRLWQVESSLECNLRCVMCPWPGIRQAAGTTGLMSPAVWDAIAPYLPDVRSIDFTGGGEPLLQKHLLDWISEAKQAGCEVGFLSNGLLLNEEISEELIRREVEWLAFSIDGATKESYERIRNDSHFETVTENIAFLSRIRTHKRPLLMLNFVIMNMNMHEMEDIVRLAKRIGVDQVNFKQCDVVRENFGKGFGVFSAEATPEVRQLKKNLKKAKRLAAKLGIRTTSFAFMPEELAVCGQDPRTSLFISHGGIVAPCINLAYGGRTTFLGKDAAMPMTHYGRLPDEDLADIWRSPACRSVRERFRQRVKNSEQAFLGSDYGRSVYDLQQAIAKAKEAMPPPPGGCGVCHYLLGI